MKALKLYDNMLVYMEEFPFEITKKVSFKESRDTKVTFSRWWFQICLFIFTPILGEDEPILTNISGQIITTSAEVTLNGGLIRELPQNPLNSGLGIILICPDISNGRFNHQLVFATRYFESQGERCFTLAHRSGICLIPERSLL